MNAVAHAITGGHDNLCSSRGEMQQEIRILQSALAAALMSVLRYTMHSILAAGTSKDELGKEFAARARGERELVHRVAKRIRQLGGNPEFDQKTLEAHAGPVFDRADSLLGMIRENLAAGLVAADQYRSLIGHCGGDSATRRMLESVLRVNDDNVKCMDELLVARKGASFQRR